MAIVAGLVCLAGLAIGMSSSVLAQEPVPTIEGFQVNWEEADPLNNTYKFTFTGSVTNCQNVTNPAVELFGYPFDTIVAPNSSGAFSVEFTMDGDVAFGRTVVATITEGGIAVSEPVSTST